MWYFNTSWALIRYILYNIQSVNRNFSGAQDDLLILISTKVYKNSLWVLFYIGLIYSFKLKSSHIIFRIRRGPLCKNQLCPKLVGSWNFWWSGAFIFKNELFFSHFPCVCTYFLVRVESINLCWIPVLYYRNNCALYEILNIAFYSQQKFAMFCV